MRLSERQQTALVLTFSALLVILFFGGLKLQEWKYDRIEEHVRQLVAEQEDMLLEDIKTSFQNIGQRVWVRLEKRTEDCIFHTNEKGDRIDDISCYPKDPAPVTDGR